MIVSASRSSNARKSWLSKELFRGKRRKSSGKFASARSGKDTRLARDSDSSCSSRRVVSLWFWVRGLTSSWLRGSTSDAS